MPLIKVRDSNEPVKTHHKGSVITSHIRNAYTRTKEQSQRMTEDAESSPSEFASDNARCMAASSSCIFPTAITQNVTYLLRSPEARVMVANSEIITMLSQSEEDQAVLMDLLKLSNEQLSYIQNAEPGCGLIKYGGLLVPFDNQIPKDSELYALMTTRPGEGVFARGQA